MKTFDKNTPIGRAFDSNSQVGVFDKNTPIGKRVGIVSDNVLGVSLGNLEPASDTGSTEETNTESEGN